MSALPFGMTGEIEITLKVSGPANSVIADLRRLRESGVSMSAEVRVLALDPPNQRLRRPYQLPEIKDGDSQAAKEHLDKLVQQRRISDEVERRLDEIVEEITQRSKR